jgi:hypothetical protein
MGQDSGALAIRDAHPTRAQTLLALLATVALTALAVVVSGDVPAPYAPSPVPEAGDANKMKLGFIPNRGQLDQRALFSAEAPGIGAYFLRDRVRLSLERGSRGAALDLEFQGARPAVRPGARERLGGAVNILRGDSRTRLPRFGEIVYPDLWPGIDMVFRGAGGRLVYELVVRPRADVGDIRLAYAGADSVALDSEGRLAVRTALGTITDAAPRTYQDSGGVRRPVSSGFALGRNGRSFGFRVGSYDRDHALVIDPGIAYSALIGPGTGEGVAVDDKGYAYVVGEAARGFPTTPGAFDPTVDSFRDAFVTKLNRDGSSLVYSTVIGGTDQSSSRAFDVAVDHDGHAYVVGDTAAPDFPTTPGAFDTTYSHYEAFVSKLSSDGSKLEYSTFFGGDVDDEFGVDTAFAVDVDEHGAAYVAGSTDSDSIPLTPGALDTVPYIIPGFFFKLNPSGSALDASTYLPSAEYGSIDLAVDRQGDAYVAGTEIFEDVPVTPGAYDTQGPGRFEPGDDAYAMKISPDATRVLYATYLGGTDDDRGYGIAVDDRGAATVLGDTVSTDFPTTIGSEDRTYNGGRDAFVTKLNPQGRALEYSTYLGGTGYDGGSAMGIASGPDGRDLVTGRTSSRDFPLTADASDRTFNGSDDAFLTVLGGQGRIAHSTYLPGGSGAEFPRDLEVDTRGDAYVAGESFSSDFPTTPGAFRSATGGAFVVKLDLPPSDPASVTLVPASATNAVDTQHCETATVRDPFGATMADVAVVFQVSGTNRADGTRTTDAAGQATFCYSSEFVGSDRITAFADFNPRNGQREAVAFPPEPQGEAEKTWAAPPPCGVKTTGTGSIVARNGDRASFKGTARSPATADLRYSDSGPADLVEFRADETLGIACGPSGAVLVFGRGTVNGTSGVSFRVELLDGGEPGKGRDTYRLLLGTGYDSGRQTLTSGNLQRHG